ncbi:hypothetical protein V7034_29405 [Priestia megaterium]|uniref:hypothetical protein n=1 Tax=Priestia megaterium TaxID=1404 RepID=UPI003000A694
MLKVLRGQIQRAQEELAEKLSQLNQEMDDQFIFINKKIDDIEKLAKNVEKSDKDSMEDKEAIIERLKKGMLTSGDVLHIMDNLENGERLDLLNKLYDLHYNFNPNSPKISEIEWED